MWTYLILTALGAGASGFAVAWLVQASKLVSAK
jgi:hypothetical protein